MKNISIKLSLIFAFSCFALSCDVLEQEPQASITPEVIFASEQGADAAVVGLYSFLQKDENYGELIPFAMDQYADVSTYAGFFEYYLDLDRNVVPATNTAVAELFRGGYATINLANIIISEVPNVDDAGYTEEERAEDIASAKTFRALAYFDLLRHFGEYWDSSSQFGMPLFTQSTGGDLANVAFAERASVDAIYQQILTDLTEAEADLPDSSDKTFVSQGFVQGLLARVYLYQKDYANAITRATQVIDNPNYELLPNYADVFSTGGNSEDIFKLLFNTQDPSSLSTFTISREEVLPDPALIAALEEDPNDTRQELLGQGPTGTQIRILKYPDGAGNSDPALVMRLAEIYFIRAEATALSGGSLDDALADINIIRERAGLDPVAAVANQDELIDLLLSEKYKEMFLEGHRFFDLVRLDRYDDVLGIEAFRRILPLPQRELDIDGNLMVQNPGYSN